MFEHELFEALGFTKATETSPEVHEQILSYIQKKNESRIYTPQEVMERTEKTISFLHNQPKSLSQKVYARINQKALAF